MNQLRVLLEDQEMSRDLPLLDLISWTRSFKATDPRDKVYALVGLATDLSQDYIDYTQHLRQVLIRLARYGFSGGRTLLLSIDAAEFLSFAVATKREFDPSVLPSWVPPFHDYPQPYIPLADCMFRVRLGDLLDRPSFEFGHNDTLSFSGALVDKIETVLDIKIHSQMAQSHGVIPEDGGKAPITVQPTILDSLLENLAIVVSMSDKRLKVIESLESYPTGEDPSDAYWRTLMCNSLKPVSRTGEPDGAVPPAEFREKWKAWEEYIRLEPSVVRFTPLPKPVELQSQACLVMRLLSIIIAKCIPRLNPFTGTTFLGTMISVYLLACVSDHLYRLMLFLVQQFWDFYFQYIRGQRFTQLRDLARPFETRLEYTCGRKFCITENGYMGLVPEVAEVGDQLLVVRGTRYLLVMHGYEEGYRLLGDAYVHGLMDGKALELPDLEFEEINLL